MRVSETIDLLIMTVTGSDPRLSSHHLLSVGPESSVPVGDGTDFRVAFGLYGFTGNGSFTIPAGSLRTKTSAGGDTAQGRPNLSNVLVHHWREGLDKELTVFDDALSPCEVTVTKQGLAEGLGCPEVADASGNRVSVVMKWDAG